MRSAIIAFALLIAAQGNAQQKQPTDAKLVMTQNVREFLKNEWDATNPKQVERAYCGFTYMHQRGDTLDIVLFLVRDANLAKPSTPYEVWAICPSGNGFTVVHTHPPTTCKKENDVNTCVLGGADAHNCEPSGNDRKFLEESHEAVNVLQCERAEFKAYWFNGRITDVPTVGSTTT